MKYNWNPSVSSLIQSKWNSYCIGAFEIAVISMVSIIV